MSKKLEQKQARRQEQERRKAEQRKDALRRNIVTITIAVLVAAAVVFAIMSERKKTEDPVGVSIEEAQCDTVEEFEAQEAQHIEEGSPHAPYNSDPPTSGPHYPSPADTGFYSAALEPERVVHNLEHGQIVIWYDPDLSAEDKDLIEEITEDDRAATVALPYDAIDDKYKLILTAWLAPEEKGSHGTGILEGCGDISQLAVNEFRKEYQGKGPEALTPPFRG